MLLKIDYNICIEVKEARFCKVLKNLKKKPLLLLPVVGLF
jgi:hypothetical protein